MSSGAVATIRKRPIVTYGKKSRTHANRRYGNINRAEDDEARSVKRTRLFIGDDHDDEEEEREVDEIPTSSLTEPGDGTSTNTTKPTSINQDTKDQNSDYDDEIHSSSLATSASPSSTNDDTIYNSDDTTTSITKTLKSASTTTTMKSTSFTLATRRKALFKRTSGKSSPSTTTNGANPSSDTTSDKPKLVQMQIDLDGVGAPRITCKECKMSYVPSAAEDAKLHKKYHSRIVEGLEFGVVKSARVVWEGRMGEKEKDKEKTAPKGSNSTAKSKGGEKENSTTVTITKFFTSGRSEKLLPKEKTQGNGVPAIPLKEKGGSGVGSSNCSVMEITRRTGVAERKKAVEFLKFANQELSAQDIEEGVLWGTSSEAGGVKGEGENFKIYLYLEGTRCVGLLLAEKITQAQWTRVKDGDVGTGSISCNLDISIEKRPCLLGISRIWTSPKHRRQGIASKLVESAAGGFVYGMTIGVEQIAFSQPTDSGAWFALKWVKENTADKKEVDSENGEDGFLVYLDSV